MAEEKTFADGFGFKRRDKAPDWAIGRLSIKIEDAIPFMKQNAKAGWINLNVNMSRGGSYYVELDTFVPTHSTTSQEAPKAAQEAETTAEENDDLPF